MDSEGANKPRTWQQSGPIFAFWGDQEPASDMADCDLLEACPAWADLRDAFEFDEELGESEPEPGDFWGVPDDWEAV